ncbi:hypothetical protein GCM10028805_31120 [Spirosoma harenae]
MKPLLKKLFTSVGLLAISLFLKGCGESSRKGYRIENGEVVIYRGWPANRSVVKPADAETFTAINTEYGKDKNHVYYIGQIIPNADPATFTYLDGAYAKDKNNGYSQENLISTDGPHFDIVPDPEETPTHITSYGIVYAHDSHKVYKGTFIVEEADPATFAFVSMFNGSYLSRDHRHVYFHDRPLEGVDGASFQKVSQFHFKDKQRAWGLVLGRDTYWSPIAEVDLATFASIGEYYAKDSQRVYFSNEVVKDADPATFEETDYLQAKDKNRTYSSGHSVTAKN